MFDKVILIIDKRIEMSTKYKKVLEQTSIKVFTSKDISKSVKILNEFEPDLIIISDSIEENLENAIRKIKILAINSRPVVVAVSKSTHLQDKINTLSAGADDFLSEPIIPQEFQAIIGAHLRRSFENNINEKTGLYNGKISLKIAKRIIESKNQFAMILVDIKNFEFYKEIYGELASVNMLKAYSAIIHSTIEKQDYVGHIKEDDFLIITTPLKAEKIAQFLVYAFDAVIEKFYSSIDSKRGYILVNGNEMAGKKIALVSTNIGVISNEYKKYETVSQVLSSLISTHKLSQMKQNSNYILERPELSGENSVLNKEYNKTVLIVEPDASLSLLLATTTQIKGLEPFIINNFKEIFNFKYEPATIILDAGESIKLQGLEVCKKLKKSKKFKNSKIILTSIIHDKERIFNAGADIYLPKPYSLTDIFNWVEKLTKEYNY